jgi:hypothetical protein
MVVAIPNVCVVTTSIRLREKQVLKILDVRSCPSWCLILDLEEEYVMQRQDETRQLTILTSVSLGRLANS